MTSLTLKENGQLWIGQSCIFLASVLTAVVTETIRDPGVLQEFSFCISLKENCHFLSVPLTGLGHPGQGAQRRP